VTANLVFRDAEGQELGEGIARACWLEHSGASVDFDVGTQSVVAVLMVLREHTTLFSFLIRHACELTIDLLL